MVTLRKVKNNQKRVCIFFVFFCFYVFCLCFYGFLSLFCISLVRHGLRVADGLLLIAPLKEAHPGAELVVLIHLPEAVGVRVKEVGLAVHLLLGHLVLLLHLSGGRRTLHLLGLLLGLCGRLRLGGGRLLLGRGGLCGLGLCDLLLLLLQRLLLDLGLHGRRRGCGRGRCRCRCRCRCVLALEVVDKGLVGLLVLGADLLADGQLLRHLLHVGEALGHAVLAVRHEALPGQSAHGHGALGRIRVLLLLLLLGGLADAASLALLLQGGGGLGHERELLREREGGKEAQGLVIRACSGHSCCSECLKAVCV